MAVHPKGFDLVEIVAVRLVHHDDVNAMTNEI